MADLTDDPTKPKKKKPAQDPFAGFDALERELGIAPAAPGQAPASPATDDPFAGFDALEQELGAAASASDGGASRTWDVPQVPEASLVDRTRDLGITAVKGAIGASEAIVGLGDLVTGGRAGRAAEGRGWRPQEARAILDSYLSPEQQAENEALANAETFGETVKAAVTNPSTIVHGAVESAPLMLGGAAVARGALAAAPKLAPMLAGAIGEGAIAAGSMAEGVRQENPDGLLTGKQTALAVGSGVATGALGVLGGRVAERMGFTDLDALLAGAKANAGVRRSAVKAIAYGAVQEGFLEELPQSVQEQIMTNAALGRPLDEGVDQAAVMGTLIGMAMGAAGQAPGATRQVVRDQQAQRASLPRVARNAGVTAEEWAAMEPQERAITLRTIGMSDAEADAHLTEIGVQEAMAAPMGSVPAMAADPVTALASELAAMPPDDPRTADVARTTGLTPEALAQLTPEDVAKILVGKAEERGAVPPAVEPAVSLEPVPQPDEALPEEAIIAAMDRAAATPRDYPPELRGRMEPQEWVRLSSAEKARVRMAAGIDPVPAFPTEAEVAAKLAAEAGTEAPPVQSTDIPADVKAAPAATTFRTAKGSTYRVEADGRTTRDKAQRPEHGDDFGPKETSERTVYVDKAGLEALGEFQTRGGAGTRRLAFTDDGRIGIQYVDGPNAGKFEKRTVVRPQDRPAEGLHPVELWNDGREVHFGNAIVGIENVPADAQTEQELAVVRHAIEAQAESARDPREQELAAVEQARREREQPPAAKPKRGKKAPQGKPAKKSKLRQAVEQQAPASAPAPAAPARRRPVEALVEEDGEMRFPSARSASDNLRPNLARITTDGLIDEYLRQERQLNDASRRAQYPNRESDIPGVTRTVATPDKDGVSWQAKAMTNIDQATRMMKRIEELVISRGHVTPDQFYDLVETRRVDREADDAAAQQPSEDDYVRDEHGNILFERGPRYDASAGGEQSPLSPRNQARVDAAPPERRAQAEAFYRDTEMRERRRDTLTQEIESAIAARRTRAYAYGRDGEAQKIAVVSRDPVEKGMIRVTRYAPDGPLGHSLYPDVKDAVRWEHLGATDLLDVDAGRVLDEWALTDRFAEGVARTAHTRDTPNRVTEPGASYDASQDDLFGDAPRPEPEQDSLFGEKAGTEASRNLAQSERAARAELAEIEAKLPAATPAKRLRMLRRQAELERLVNRGQAIGADEMAHRARAEQADQEPDAPPTDADGQRALFERPPRWYDPSMIREEGLQETPVALASDPEVEVGLIADSVLRRMYEDLALLAQLEPDSVVWRADLRILGAEWTRRFRSAPPSSMSVAAARAQVRQSIEARGKRRMAEGWTAKANERGVFSVYGPDGDYRGGDVYSQSAEEAIGKVRDLPSGPRLVSEPSAPYDPNQADMFGGFGDTPLFADAQAAAKSELAEAPPSESPQAAPQPPAADRSLRGELRAAIAPAPAEPQSETVPDVDGALVDVSPDDVDYRQAFDAYRWNSMTPERRAKSEQGEYVRHMRAVAADLEPLATTPEQREQLRAELARYKAGYLQRVHALLAATSRTASPMVTGPANFPVARNRKALETEARRRTELLDYTKRAQSAMRGKFMPEESRAISSDDADAPAKLRAKIEAAEQMQQRMLDGNKIIRSKKLTDAEKIVQLDALGLTPENARQALTPDYMGRTGFPSFTLSNNNANIRRMKDRLAELERRRAQPTTEQASASGVRLVQDVEANRVQLIFPGKPDRPTIDLLKSRGFRWAPSVGAWQRQLTNAGIAAAQEIVRRVDGAGGNVVSEQAPHYDAAPVERGVRSFYSRLDRAIEAAPFEKGTAEQWAAALSKNVAKGEREWTGVEAFLTRHPGRVLTKHQLGVLLSRGRVNLSEMVLDDTGVKAKARLDRAYDTQNALLNDLHNKYGDGVRLPGKLSEADTERLAAADREVADAERAIDAARATWHRPKFESYTEPGGENYREILIRLTDSPQTFRTVDEVARDLGYGGWSSSLTSAQQAHVNEVWEAQRHLPRRAEDSTSDVFRTSHFDQPNILAHARVKDRTLANGERVLFIEEIQSDWHQQGRQKGYRDTAKLEDIGNRIGASSRAAAAGEAALRATVADMGAGSFDGRSMTYWDRSRERDGDYVRLGTVAPARTGGGYEVLAARDASPTQVEALQQIADAMAERERALADRSVAEGAIPDAPFKKTDEWVGLVLRRLMDEAVAGGYDRIAWTTGDQQAARYDLSKQVRSIGWNEWSDGSRLVTIEPLSGNDIEFRVTPEGQVRGLGDGPTGTEFDGKRLSDVVGKEVADKVMAARDGSLSGAGLRVGGAGMRAFYDEMLPKQVREFAKKLGVKVEVDRVAATGAGKDDIRAGLRQAGDEADARDDTIVRDAVDAILEDMRQGESFEDAYEMALEIAERDFDADAPDRIRAAVDPIAAGDAARPLNASVRITPEFARAFDERGRYVMEPVTAYHGTPHRFDRFSTKHIGSGEGAQVYGWGLYFASKPEVARWYRDKLSSDVPTSIRHDILMLDALGFDSWRQALDAIRAHPDWMTRWDVQLNDAQEREAAERVEAFARNPPGALFEVGLPDDQNMLDWDTKLTEQPEYVKAILDTAGLLHDDDVRLDGMKPGEYLRAVGLSDTYALAGWGQSLVSEIRRAYAEGLTGAKALERAIDRMRRYTGYRRDQIADRDTLLRRIEALDTRVTTERVVRDWLTGEDLYRELRERRLGDGQGQMSDEAASKYLLSLGIPGIRYLDGSSRGRGDGSHNYVIFDGDKVEIRAVMEKTRRYQDPAQGDLFMQPPSDATPITPSTQPESELAFTPAQLTIAERALEKLRAAGLPVVADRASGVAAARAKSYRIDFRGQSMASPKDAALVMQALRNPAFEMLTVFYLDAKGKIAGHETLTTGMLNFAIIPDNWPDLIAADAKRLRATHVIFGHNHPSGDPTPSADDRLATSDLSAKLRPHGVTVLGHVVINHDKAAWIDEVKNDLYAFAIPADRGATWKTGPEMGTPKIHSPDMFAAALKQSLDPDALTVVYLDTQHRIIAIEPREPGDMATIDQWLPAQRQSVAAAAVFIAAPPHIARDLATEAGKDIRVPYGHWAGGLLDIFAVSSLTGQPSVTSLAMTAQYRGPSEMDPLNLGISQVASFERGGDYDADRAGVDGEGRVGAPDAGAESGRAAAGDPGAGAGRRTAPGGRRSDPRGEGTERRAAGVPARHRVAEPAPSPFPQQQVDDAFKHDDIDFSGEAAKAARKRRGTLRDHLNRFADAIANGFGAIERLGEQVEGDLPPTRNPRDLLTTLKNSDYTVARFMNEGVVDPETREITGPSFKGLFDRFKRDPERIRIALKYVKAERDVGRGLEGMGGDEAGYALAQERVKIGRADPELRAFAADWKAFVDGIGTYAVKSGLWTPEMWEKIRASDALYVRYKRILQEDVRQAAGERQGPSGAAPKRLVNVGPGVQRFEGSKLPIQNPAEAMAEYVGNIIRRADRYRVGAALFDAADAMGSEGVFLITRIKAADAASRGKAAAHVRERAKDLFLSEEALETLMETFDVRFDPENPIIWRNNPRTGKKEYAQVNSPELWRAVAALNATDDSALRTVLNYTLRPIKRVFVATTTGLSPRFALGTNPIRDLITAAAQTRGGRTVADVVWGYAHGFLGEIGRGHSALAAEAKAWGLGNVSLYRQETQPTAVARRVAPVRLRDKLRTAIVEQNPAAIGVRGLERIGDASDKGPRLAEYMASLRRNQHRVTSGEWTIADLRLRAATEARPVTIDFANKPGNAVMRFFSDYIPFFGPATQAPVVMARAAERNPKRVVGVAAAVVLATVLAWAMKKAIDSEDEDELKDKINDRAAEERASYLMVPIDRAGGVLRVPLPQEFGFLSALVTGSLDWLVDEDPHAAELVQAASIRLLPPGIVETLSGVPPVPGLQQVAENQQNRAIFGDRPIEPRSMSDLPVSERRRETTAPTFDMLAAGARKVGFESVSPLKAEHLVRGVTSTATPLITTALDPIASRVTGRPTPRGAGQPISQSAANPASVFVRKDPPSSTQTETDYYDLRARAQQARTFERRARNVRDREARQRAREEFAPELRRDLQNKIKQTDRLIDRLRDREAAIRARRDAGTMAPDAAREQLAAIRTTRHRVMRNAVAWMRQRGIDP